MNYKEKTNRELIELLAIHKKLTFQSQLNLKEELNHRNIQDNTSELKNTINSKISEIENLEYLKNIGFKAEKLNDSIKVTRTQKAVLIDMVSIFFGIIFCIIGFFGVLSLVNSFSTENDFSLFSLIIEIGMIVIGYIGVKFLNGISRLIDYSGFELSNAKRTITLKKRFDTKLVEIQKNESLLELKEESKLITLRLDNIDVFNANKSNIVQRMTMHELAKKLKIVAKTV